MPAMSSREAPAGRVTVSPVSVRAVSAAMPAWSMSWAARAGSAQSTCTDMAPALWISSSMGPWWITHPWSTIATASQVRSTSSSRCEDSTTVRPPPARLAIIPRISCMPAGSRPFIGSSSIRSSGSASRHAATPRRWRMPIEYDATRSSARSARPTLANDGAIRVPASPARAAASRRRFCRPVRCGWKRGSSTIAPTRARALLRWAGTGVPSSDIVPSSALVRPSRVRISVVLPTQLRVLCGLTSGNRRRGARRPELTANARTGPVVSVWLVGMQTNTDYTSDYGYAGVDPRPDIRGQDTSI
jgi:hypothetical protein